jgi:hypothetical protein
MRKGTNKKITLLIFSLLLSIALLILFIKREELVYLLPAKEPQILRDLAYDKDKRLGYTVYVKEEGKLTPYMVLTKDYLDQGNVLLLRQHLVNPPMSFREGWEEAYYGHSIPDSFMHKEFIKRFSKDVQKNIPSTELGINPSEVNAGRGDIEKITRKLFLLSDIDVGKYKDKLRLEKDENLLYFKRKRGMKEGKLAFLENNSTPYSWWLRTTFETDSSVAKVIDYEGKFGGNGVAYISYVRPAFTLPPDMEIEEKEIDGQKNYVLKREK